MESIDKWFQREVIQWRTGAAIAWSVITLPIISIVYLFLTSFQLFHPLQWTTDFVSSLFSLTFLSNIVLIMLVNAGFYVYSKNTYTVIPTMSITRFSQLPQLCKGSVMMYAALCWGCGLILGWVCTCILGDRYTSLSKQCAADSELYCINEYHLFVVLYGGFTGKMYIVYHYINQNNVLHFPTLQQAKFFQVRGRMPRTAWSALGHVIFQIKFFYIFYYLFGNIPRDAIAETLSLKFERESRLDSLFGLLFDVALLWQTILVGLFIQFSWCYGALLYKVYNTQYYEFPVSTMFDNFKNKCLVDSLSCTNLPLLQALGFMDLDLLAKHSYTRRKELFSLSQPGGHPHNWNKILAVCLAVIQEMNDTVQEVNWKILANAPVRQPHAEKTASNGTSDGLKHRSSTTDGTSKPATSAVKDKIVNGLKKRSLLTFFTGEVPDNTHKNLFASAFIQIWAVDALSSLVVASFHEDSFGVVQMSLRDIITVILNLQENIDKHFKLTGGVSRRVTKDVNNNDVPLKYLLQSSLKSSIYSIINTFGKHLLDIGLPMETEKKLHHFLDYRE
ncbi:nucleoporin NDC1-like [Ruditapes philippinarum]|uniref:nucleoporin NDC1-like n=1 Tax=Ruditapes philippinarum TaxID=129788 RepID=UPI00295C0B63|nr:nucleoporin NDC1-like [Ruditapes philippinarum]